MHVNNKFSATIFFCHRWFDTSTVAEVTAWKNERKGCDVADNNRQQSENITLYDQETHISIPISMKVGDRN